MRPYLTVTLTYAPGVMVFLTSPEAVMRSALPLWGIISPSQEGRICRGRFLRLGGVRSQVDFLDFNEVVVTVGAAELDGVLSRDLERSVECGGRIAPDGEGRGRSGEAGSQIGDGGRETHRCRYLMSL